MTDAKSVIVGDGCIGKTCLVFRIHNKSSPPKYIGSIYDPFSIAVKYENEAINLALFDTADLETYLCPKSMLKPPKTDVFVICFSLVSPESLENVEKLWVPEIRYSYPDTPYILVGLKSDLRDGFSEHADELRSQGWEPITRQQGEEMKERIHAQDYLECSAKTGNNVQDVLQTIARVALHLPLDEKKSKKEFSFLSKSKSKPKHPDSEKLAELQQSLEQVNQIVCQLQEKLTQERQQHEIELSQVKQQYEIELKKQRNDNEKKLLEFKKTKLANENSQSNELKFLDEEEMNDYEQIEELGSVGGKVFKVSKRPFFAIKEMNIKNANTSTLRSFMNEYEIINVLHHPNIIKTYGIHLSSTTIPPSIVLEFCPSNLVNEIEHGSLSNVTIIQYIYQIAEGMKFIHSKNIIHRDIKPSNILISDEGLIKIADFGISKIMSVEEQTMTCGIGTQHYMSPEVLDGDDYTEKADVYSFGVVLYYILTGGQLPNIKLSDLFKRKKPTLPSSLTSFAKSLIEKCMDYDSNERPSFEMILDELDKNRYNLVPLNEHQISQVREFVQEHKDKIEACQSFS